MIAFFQPPPRADKVVLAHHPQWGLFIGLHPILGPCWSRLNPCGSIAAWGFLTVAEARSILYRMGMPAHEMTFIIAVPDTEDGHYVSLEQCARLGHRWINADEPILGPKQ